MIQVKQNINYTPEMWGAIGDGLIDDTSAVQAAVDYLTSSGNRVLTLEHGKTYKITGTITIPSYSGIGYLPKFTINGNQAKLLKSGSGYTIQKIVTGQSTGAHPADSEVNSRLEIKDVIFEGDGTTNCNGILSQATYGTDIEGCTFNSLYNAIVIEFGLQSYIGFNKFINGGRYNIQVSQGTYSGADGSNSQSNQTVIENNRHYATEGQLALVKVKNSSHVTIENDIYEGHNPVRNIDADFTGTVNVRTFFVNKLHIENTPSDSSIFLKLSAGIYEIKSIWCQTYHTLVKVSKDSVPYSDLKIVDLPYMSNYTGIFAHESGLNANGQNSLSGVNWTISSVFGSTNGSNYNTFLDNCFIQDSTYRLPSYRNFIAPGGNFSNNYYANYISTDAFWLSSIRSTAEKDFVVKEGIIFKDSQPTPHYWRVKVDSTGTFQISDLGESIP